MKTNFIGAIFAFSTLLSFSAEVISKLEPGFSLEIFAENPQIVTPIGIAVDSKKRVFVLESHTHHRPGDYDGPPSDVIKIFEDKDGDGRADASSVFASGF